ncbi:tripartite tricarboxylate transporter permease [Chelativorans sp. SCAU2101]|uniref:Tripartite tricarboxylate transporter permease n=1 Tax=Chelativorans petroleitrophicus TaxID=2975484 RepID=A0A9X3B6E2_9HYPH|nr:tripartite tricarboxylate transporter permease [Chelativorans petroleitrophicus]
MDALVNLAHGFERALSLEALLFCFIGVTVGTFVGALPGIGALAAISLSLPLTYYLDPMVALIMLAGIFYGTQYGSSISAILLNLPGTPASAITCLEAYPMTKSGRAGPALFITAIASFVGGSIGIVFLMGFTPVLAKFAIGFSSADYFGLILFCLVGASMLGVGSPLKGLCMVAVGLLLGLVGTDVTSGTPRFTLGIPMLTDGIDLVAMMMGLFGVAEILSAYSKGGESLVSASAVALRSLIPTRQDVREAGGATLRGSLVGAVIGVLPGMGATLATFIAYGLEKRISRNPEKFAHGAVEGVASPEAANNASVQTAFIPTLGIGIPGDAVMAVLIAAMMIHGIQAGPLFMVQQADLFWGVVASMWIGNVMLLILNIPLIGLWVRILTIPSHVLYPSILLLVCIGVYSVNNNVNDIIIVIVFGAVGYVFGMFGYPMASLVLGVILAPLLEEHLRRALLLSDGNYMIFLQRPLSATFLALTALFIVFSFKNQLMALFSNERHGDVRG